MYLLVLLYFSAAGAYSMVQVQPGHISGQCPSSAPVPPQGVPGGLLGATCSYLGASTLPGGGSRVLALTVYKGPIRALPTPSQPLPRCSSQSRASRLQSRLFHCVSTACDHVRRRGADLRR